MPPSNDTATDRGTVPARITAARAISTTTNGSASEPMSVPGNEFRATMYPPW